MPCLAPLSQSLEKTYLSDMRYLSSKAISLCAAGIGRYMPRFWYRKLFDLPKHWEGSRILLNFGAVDWQCQVFVNGQEMGTHTGGYDKVWLPLLEANVDVVQLCPPRCIKMLQLERDEL